MPDYRADNPYQQLYADEQQAKNRNLQIVFPNGYKRVFPLLRQCLLQKPNTLQLHWPNPYIKGEIFVIKLFYALKFLLDCLLLRILGVRLQWVMHNVVSHNAKFPSLELLVYRILVRLCNQCIAHTATARSKFAKAYCLSEAEITLIPHPSYLPLYPKPWPSKQDARAKLNLPNELHITLHFGFLAPYKGTLQLLDYWLKEKNKTVEFLLIAGKTKNEFFAKEIRNKIQELNNARWDEGFIPNEKIPVYMQAVDCVAIPYTNITTSGSEVLARDFGKEIITTLV